VSFLLERALRRISREANASAAPGRHADEPLIALMRAGDLGEDISDAIAHVARCPDCRAKLVEGEIAQRSIVVMAIEAPRASSKMLTEAAEASRARLVARGGGRWTALVDTKNADKLKGALEKGDTSVVTRLVASTPLDVSRDDASKMRARMGSLVDLPENAGTEAAEVNAWAQIPRQPRKKVPGPSPAWALFGTFAIVGAAAIAYWFATR
jgi:hypothetical protein